MLNCLYKFVNSIMWIDKNHWRDCHVVIITIQLWLVRFQFIQSLRFLIIPIVYFEFHWTEWQICVRCDWDRICTDVNQSESQATQKISLENSCDFEIDDTWPRWVWNIHLHSVNVHHSRFMLNGFFIAILSYLSILIY